METNEPHSTLRVEVDITPYRYSGADVHLLAELVTFVVKRCATAEVTASRRSLRVTAMVPAAELHTIDGFMSRLKEDVQTECDRLRSDDFRRTMVADFAEGACSSRSVHWRPPPSNVIPARLVQEWFHAIRCWEFEPRPDSAALLTGVRIMHIMPTFARCKDVWGEYLRSALVRSGLWSTHDAQFHRTNMRVTFPGGSWIRFVGLERANDLRGLRADIVSTEACDGVDLSAILTPLLSEPWSLRHVMTCVPSSPGDSEHA